MTTSYLRSFLAHHLRPGGATAGDGRARAVVNLALPAVGEQVLNMTVGLVDTFLVGHLGAASIAGLSFANQFVMLAIMLISSIATGSTVLIARAVGAGDKELARRTVNQSLLLAGLMGLVTTALGTLLSGPAVRLMGADADALPLGVAYLQIVSCSFLPTALLFAGNACLRGAGDTRTTMRIMLLINVVNIAVASSLIYGPLGLPRLGVVGSALGAACARTLGGIVVLLLLARGKSGLQLAWRVMRVPDLRLIRRVLQIGIPTGIEMLLMRLADMSFFRTVATLGTAACAAHAVAMNAQSLSFAPGFGFAIAATTLVGQALGARDPQRAERDGYLAFQLGGGVMTVMGVVFLLFARQIIGFFTDDPQVVALGAGPLQVIAFGQPLFGASMIFSGALRGAGDTRWPMLANGLSMWVVRLSLALFFVLALRLGLVGAWYAMVADVTVRAALNFLRFRRGGWKRIEV